MKAVLNSYIWLHLLFNTTLYFSIAAQPCLDGRQMWIVYGCVCVYCINIYTCLRVAREYRVYIVFMTQDLIFLYAFVISTMNRSKKRKGKRERDKVSMAFVSHQVFDWISVCEKATELSCGQAKSNFSDPSGVRACLP